MSRNEDVRLDGSILDAFCAECPSTACDLPGDQAKCATLLLIGSIWARGTDLYYALMEAWKAQDANYNAADAVMSGRINYEEREAYNYDAWAAHDKVEGILARQAGTSHDGETTPDGRSRREG